MDSPPNTTALHALWTPIPQHTHLHTRRRTCAHPHMHMHSDSFVHQLLLAPHSLPSLRLLNSPLLCVRLCPARERPRQPGQRHPLNWPASCPALPTAQMTSASCCSSMMQPIWCDGKCEGQQQQQKERESLLTAPLTRLRQYGTAAVVVDGRCTAATEDGGAGRVVLHYCSNILHKNSTQQQLQHRAEGGCVMCTCVTAVLIGTRGSTRESLFLPPLSHSVVVFRATGQACTLWQQQLCCASIAGATGCAVSCGSSSNSCAVYVRRLGGGVCVCMCVCA